MTFAHDAAVIVTGGDTGIGAGICSAFAGAGVRVMMNYHGDIAPANELAEKLRAQGGTVEVFGADISQPEEVAALEAQTLRVFGTYTMFVNNAGIEKEYSLLDMPFDVWKKTIDVNLTGSWLCLQRAAQYFVRQKIAGRIINISSIHEDRTMPGNIAYCASKGGMRMMMRNAAVELGKHGITVNNICPGAIATPINNETLHDPKKLAALQAAIPLQRLGTPKDLGELCLFLGSQEASYISGASLTIDGGMSQQSSSL